MEKKKKERRTPVAEALSQKPMDSHGICVSDSGDMNLNGKKRLAYSSLTFYLTMIFPSITNVGNNLNIVTETVTLSPREIRYFHIKMNILTYFLCSFEITVIIRAIGKYYLMC